MKMYPLCTIVIAVSTILAGCSDKVATHDDAIKSITEAPVMEEVADKKWSAAESYGVVDDDWLKSFNDPQLLILVEEAQKNNYGLKISSAQVDRAEALAKQAGAALKPTVGLSGGYRDQSGGNLNELYGGGIKIGWEPDVWGRVGSATAAASEAAAASRSDYEFARQSLAAATAKSWFIAVGSKILQDYAIKIVELQKEALRIVEAKKKVGQGTMKDVHLAKANLAKAEDAARNAQSALENAKRSLEVLLGRYPSADIGTPSKFVATLAPVATGIPSAILERRPDLIAAEQRVAAAFFKQKEAELLHLPSFNFSIGLGVSNLKDAASSLAAGIFAPLYTGGAIEAEVEKATAEQKQAIALYAQKALDAFKEVENTMAAEEALSNREEYLRLVVDENFSAYELTQKQFDVGKISFLDVLTVQGKWIEAQIASIDVSTRRLLNRVSLHLALGGSFSDSLSENSN